MLFRSIASAVMILVTSFPKAYGDASLVVSACLTNAMATRVFRKLKLGHLTETNSLQVLTRTIEFRPGTVGTRNMQNSADTHSHTDRVRGIPTRSSKVGEKPDSSLGRSEPPISVASEDVSKQLVDLESGKMEFNEM